mgnify:CR=1 FL=1
MTDRDRDLHQARVYLQQSRATPHRAWSILLLEWAGNARRRAMSPAATVQGDLFT